MTENLWTIRQNAMLAVHDAQGPGFGERADEFLRSFAASGREFIAEEVVAAAARVQLIASDPRAWGAVLRRAVIKGVIVHTGKFSTATTNACPKKIWMRA